MTELSYASLQRMILEERAALATPIDFADLERRGILFRATNGWFVLRQPKALPGLRLEAGHDGPRRHAHAADGEVQPDDA